MGSGLAFAVELAQQLFLPLGQLDRGLHRQLDIQVALLGAAQHRHTLAAQAELPPRLGAFGDRHLGAATVQGRHLDGAAQGGGDEADRGAAMQVMAVTLEDRMLGHRQENVEIAIRAAIGARRALARQTDAGALLHPRRHVHRQGAFLLHQARALADLAGIADHLAAAAALAAGAFDGEEALGGADLAMPGAAGAGLGAGARLRAAAGAGLAGQHGGHLDLGAAAGEGLFQGDFQIVAQILAAIGPLAPAHAAHHLAEQVFKDVAEAAEIAERIAAARAGAAHSPLEGAMAEAVIGGALLIVLQDVIGFVDFLELDLGGVVVRILVRVEFHRQLAIGRFQRGAVTAFGDFQGFVIATLGAHGPT